MHASLRGCLAFALVAVCTAATAAATANIPSTTYVDKTDGFAITVPTTWKLVPRSTAALAAAIAALKKTKKPEQLALASTYSSIGATASGRTGLTAYRFQAFAWPPDITTPLLTEVSLGVVKTSRAYGSADLTPLGDEYANALAANTGSRILVPKTVRLPAGNAEFVEGTIPAGNGGLATGVELYLIPHGKRVYELSFQIDARGLSQAKLFTSIADHFAFA
jgi:hypothetical protein